MNELSEQRADVVAELLAALEEARDALFSGAPVTVGLKFQIEAAIRAAKEEHRI